MNIFDAEEENKLHGVYKAYKDYLYWISYGIVGNEFGAEDVVQLVLFKVSKVLRAIDLRQGEKTKMFLKIVARNTALDYCRERQQGQEAEPADEADDIDIIEWKQDGEDVVEGDSYERLLKKIERLPDKYADVLRLKYVFGLTEREVAEMLSLREEVVHTRLGRAKRMLWRVVDGTE